MVIKLKYMGVIHDKMPDVLDLEEGTNVKTLKTILMNMSDEELKPILSNASFIVNNMNANDDTVLNDNDKVLVLTPLGGG
jgi:molybdopterin converting factor small subunit